MTRYDAGYLLLSLLSFPFWMRYLTRSRYRSLLRARLVPEKQGGAGPGIWLHAVSVGEVNSLLSLIDDLAGQYPGHRIVLTVSTPSGYRHALDKARHCTVLPAPIDFSFSIRRFIAIHRPVLIVLNELEIWPNWLTIARRQGIPLILVNARLSDRAFSRYLFFRRFSAAMLNRIERILCQSDHYRQRFRQLGIDPERLITSGHIKADEAVRQVAALPDRASLRKELGLVGARKILLFASCHSQDEAVFMPLLDELRQSHQVIIAPRHLERLTAIRQELAGQRIAYRLGSENQQTGNPDEAIVIDRMGQLLALMSIADLVVMGGTFSAKTGGHNLFEPLACHKITLGGPHTENFPDIARDLLNEGLYLRFSDSAELRTLLQQPPAATELTATRAQRLLARYRGANQTILREIQRCLPS